MNNGKVEDKRIPTGGLTKLVIYLSKVVDPLVGFGSVIACTMLAAMMFLVFVDVVGRDIGSIRFIQEHVGFVHPIIGSNEVTEFLMIILAAFAVAYTAQKKGHVRVDVVLQYVSKKANVWFDIFANAFSFIFFFFITWQGWLYALDRFNSKVSSSVLLIPVYPFVFIMIIGTAILTLVFLRDFLKSIDEVGK